MNLKKRETKKENVSKNETGSTTIYNLQKYGISDLFRRWYLYKDVTLTSNEKHRLLKMLSSVAYLMFAHIYPPLINLIKNKNCKKNKMFEIKYILCKKKILSSIISDSF